MKFAAKYPRLTPNEIALRLEFEIPDKLFQRPVVTAKLKIPDEVVLPDKINTAVTDNIEEAIKSVTGLEMRVSVVEPAEEP